MKNVLSNSEVSEICYELAMLMHAGTGISDSLYILADDVENETIRTILINIAKETEDGISFAKAVAKSQVFPNHVSKLINVGEKSGRTEEALVSLADYYDDRDRMDHRIKTALLYPSILLIVMLAVLVVLLVYVLPVFNDVYAQLGSSLTGIAVWLMKFGNILQGIMPVLTVLLGIATIFIILFCTSDLFRAEVLVIGRKRSSEGSLSWKVARSRFAQALYMGITSGLSNEEAVLLAAETVEDTPAFHKCAEICAKEIADGAALPEALDKSELMQKAECRILSSAIKSGETDKALEHISDKISDEAGDAISQAISKIEPSLVVAASVIIGAILLSVMLPLINIMSSIG